MKKKEIAAKRDRAERRRNLARAIDLTWSALRTHLADTVEAREANPEWQARCCREYAEVIYSLAVELHELTKKDFGRNFVPLNEPI
jgi:hypothetical protein